MADDFAKDLIKAYDHWEIYVHENQGYLGRCIVWCKRADALDLTDATPEEQAELFVVLKDLASAARHLFQPDWLNYSFLGNGVRHLHGHFIPRYATQRVFMNRVFEDVRYGHHYRTDYTVDTPPELRKAVRDAYRGELAL